MDWEHPNLTQNFELFQVGSLTFGTSRISVTQPPGPAHWTTPLPFSALASRDTEPAHKWPSEVGSRGGVRSRLERGRGRGSWRRVLAGREPEVQTSCFSLSQAEPVRLGPAAAKELSPAPTVVAAHSLAHAAARGASFPRVPLLGVPATCARPAGPARCSDVRQGVHVGPEERRLGRGEGLCGQGERGCAEVAEPGSPERAPAARQAGETLPLGAM